MVITNPDTMIRIICPNLKSGCDVEFAIADDEGGYELVAGKLESVNYYRDRLWAKILRINKPILSCLYYSVPLEEVEFVNGNN